MNTNIRIFNELNNYKTEKYDNFIDNPQNYISFFNSVTSTKSTQNISVQNVLSIIKSPRYRNNIEKIRNANSKHEKGTLKRSLCPVTFAGSFPNRTVMKHSSGYACLDFDHMTNLDEARQILRKSDYVFSYFLSPSGNGLKVLIRIPKISNQGDYKIVYKRYYFSLLDHFKDLNPDSATSDINRLCYLSYDPDLYCNPNSLIYDMTLISKASPKTLCRKSSSTNEIDKARILIKSELKKNPILKGNRNHSIYKIACMLTEYGVTESTIKQFLMVFAESDFLKLEINRTIRSAVRSADFNSKHFV